MESASRQEYPAMLDTLEPSRAMTVLNDRMKHVGTLNAQVADWLQERRRIEELYVANLRKLAQKAPPDDTSDLGVFTTPWQKILSSTTSLAESHHALAAGIESDIVGPLRSFTSTNREVQSMTTMQGNLASLAKDYDLSQKKADKLNSKSGKSDANKVANASSDFDNAASQWSSQAPYVFEALQAVDESRCNQLRDLLTQYQTLEVDLVQRNRKTAENTLNSLLNVETPNEIRTFAARNSGSGSGPTARGPSTRRPSAPQRPSRSGRADSSTAAPFASSLAPPSSGADELSKQRSPSVNEEKKSRLSGLKRLGTVVGRRKSMQPQFDRRDSGRGAASTSNLGASVMSNGDQMSPVRERTSDSYRASQSTPSRGQTVDSLGATQQSPSRGQISDPLGDVQPPPGPPPGSGSRGLGTLSETSNNIPSSPPRSSSLANGISQLQTPLAPQTTAIRDELAPPPAPPPKSIDHDGFAVPPPSTDPISQAQQQSAGFGDLTSSMPKAMMRDTPITDSEESSESAMASTVARLREQAAQPRRTSTLRGRRDVRSQVYPAATPPPMAEESQQLEPEESATMLPPIASGPPQMSTSREQPESILPSAPSVSPPAIFNTPFISSLQSGQPSASPPPILDTQRPPTGEDDNQSVRSGRSTNTLSTAIQHPNLTGPGLTSSIIETISAWQESGNVTRATVIGELALAHTLDLSDPSSSAGASPNATIRLAPFSTLSKVAPNPAFVQPSTSHTAQPGDYSIALPSITRTTIAFKYQLHLSASELALQAPLTLTPAWRIEPTQTSVIVSYAASSALTAPLTLHDLVLAVYLGTDGAQAASCLSKPQGTFSRERGLIYWKLDELILLPGGPAQKLLARFQTEGQATQGRVEARWEARGEALGLGSGLNLKKMEASADDPFADSAAEGEWKDVIAVRKICSGTYVAS